MGQANLTPELEIYSYVLLFPRSFGSFINWYHNFRKIAKQFLYSFKSELSHKLDNNNKMSLLATKIIIESRLKTPSSAFKKMLKVNNLSFNKLLLFCIKIVSSFVWFMFIGSKRKK